MKWSERQIASAVAKQVLERKCLVIVPNCSWPGSECDLLAITSNLRVIDVEIKISRADLKVDAKKDKWFHNWNWQIDGPWNGPSAPRRQRQWPANVWKHYYALPEEIWSDELMDCLGSPQSGVLLLGKDKYSDRLRIKVKRMAKPCRDAKKIDPEHAIDIARLASLRMWDAYDRVDELLAANRALRAANDNQPAKQESAVTIQVAGQ